MISKLVIQVLPLSLSLSLSLSLRPFQSTLTLQTNLDCNQIGESGVTSLFHPLSANTSLAHLILNGKDIGLAGDAFP